MSEDEWTVRVFRDGPEWDRHERWFLVPVHVLNALYVATYTLRDHGRPTEECEAVRTIRRENPGCVLVY